ncbi:hypothetical protein CC2G_007802 [Coprinopsis cinerea AmutBmut pab1-1]|nr:hypothetical protein CC2G_007802 [Coprinopsis cinerea AmutBmut pab1-1]
MRQQMATLQTLTMELSAERRRFSEMVAVEGIDFAAMGKERQDQSHLSCVLLRLEGLLAEFRVRMAEAGLTNQPAIRDYLKAAGDIFVQQLVKSAMAPALEGEA